MAVSPRRVAVAWPPRPRVSGAWRLLVCGALLTVTPAPALAADPTRAIETDATNVESQVRLTVGEIRSAIVREKRYPLDQRFVEATLAYERHNHAVASVLLYDLVWNSEFQRSRDYYEALYLLGDSLYRQRNFRAARSYLDQVIKRPGGKHFEDALQSLVDIAIRVRSFEDVSQYATHLKDVPGGSRRSALLYQFGRSYMAASKFGEARKYLGQVGIGEKSWPAARFYLGAIDVHENRLEEAKRAFADVVSAGKSQEKASRPPPLVLDYASLALARLELHAKNYKPAIELYQRIDRSSAVYEEALFELAACQVAAGQPRQALSSLDLLLLSVTDDNVAVEAAVLRGRINLNLKEYDAADGAYKEVVDQYSAINGEMTRFAQSTKLLEQFFTWLLHRGGDDYSVVRPVSERVARYVERDPDMGRVVELFDEMAGEKRDVRESARLAEQLTAAMQSNTRLEMFPVLRDKWLTLLESENKLVQIGQRIVELLAKSGDGSLNAEEKSRAQALLALNKRLLVAFSQMPATVRAYSMRQSRIDTSINEMSAQISLLRSQLAMLRDELQATEKVLNERVFGAEAVNMTKEREEDIRRQIEEEKHELRRLAREIEKLTTDIELDATRMGSNDDVNADESRLRGALLANQRALQVLYSGAMRRTGLDPSQIQRLGAVRSGIDQSLIEIAGGFRTIDGRVREKTNEMSKVLEKERENIARYQVSVAQYEEESRRIARDIGYVLIRRAQGRLADIVLEADLGLVDVAWQRKQDKAATVRELQDERAGKMRSLQGVLESLVGGDEDEEAP